MIKNQPWKLYSFPKCAKFVQKEQLATQLFVNNSSGVLEKSHKI